MIELAEEELYALLFALEEWRGTHSNWKIYKDIKNKIEFIVRDLSLPKQTNTCKCNEQYLSNNCGYMD